MSTIVFLSTFMLILAIASAFLLGFAIKKMIRESKLFDDETRDEDPSNPWSIM